MQYFDRKRFGAQLNGFFDQIHCINLDSRPDRWKHVQREFSRFGLSGKVSRFPGIDLRSEPELLVHEKLQKDKYSVLANCGCILSHRKIIDNARQSGCNNVLVFEDDIKFLEENTPHIGKSLAELAEIEWEVFYLGATYINKIEKVGQNLVRVSSGAYATHAIAYNQSVFEKVLDILPSNPLDYLQSEKFLVNAIDVWLQSDHFNHNHFYGTRPMMAVQGLQESDISTAKLDLEKIQLSLYDKNLEKGD